MRIFAHMQKLMAIRINMRKTEFWVLLYIYIYICIIIYIFAHMYLHPYKSWPLMYLYIYVDICCSSTGCAVFLRPKPH